MSSFNPFSADFSADPYSAYRRLREEADVFSVPGCRGRDWIVLCFEGARAALADPRFLVDDLPVRIRAAGASAECAGSVEPLCRTLSNWLFFLDGTAHTAMRESFAVWFGKSAMQAVRQRITPMVHRLCQAALAHERPDIIADIARPLPALIATQVLGFRSCDIDTIARLSVDLFGIFTQPLALRRYQAIDASLRKLHALVADLMLEDQRRPSGALVTSLLRAQESGKLTAEQTIAFCSMLLSVGQETTQNLIGNAVYALLEHPAELQRLCAEPGLIGSALREVARYYAPVQLIVRIAAGSLELCGNRIQRDERVHLFLGAALRDPMVYPKPDVFDIARPPGNPLPYGGSRHFCLGFQLAQLAAELTLLELLPHLSQLQSPTTPDWLRSVHMRGLRSLRVARNAA